MSYGNNICDQILSTKLRLSYGLSKHEYHCEMDENHVRVCDQKDIRVHYDTFCRPQAHIFCEDKMLSYCLQQSLSIPEEMKSLISEEEALYLVTKISPWDTRDSAG